MKTAAETALKKKSGMNAYKRQITWQLSLIALPMVIYIFIFNYCPLPGILIAFQDYSYEGGIFGSRWVGIDNFVYLFKSNDLFRIVRNTIVHNIIGIAVGMCCSLLVALMMDRVVKRWQVKTFQTLMFLPYFISWVIVSYMASTVLSYDKGVLNKMIQAMGGEPISWYMTPNAWWFIIPIVSVWKGVGSSAVVNYGYIIGVDRSIYEAAYIDGCTEWKRMIYITIPMIKPAIIVSLIMSIGGIIRGDFGLFYYLTNNQGMLYPVTDIIDTYVFRAIMKTGDISGPAAVGLFQSIVGCVMVLGANQIVKWLDPESRMF